MDTTFTIISFSFMSCLPIFFIAYTFNNRKKKTKLHLLTTENTKLPIAKLNNIYRYGKNLQYLKQDLYINQHDVAHKKTYINWEITNKSNNI